MTNYADRDSCYWCGVTKTGRAGQVEIANLVHGETEVEEIDDGGNQGGVVVATVNFLSWRFSGTCPWTRTWTWVISM